MIDIPESLESIYLKYPQFPRMIDSHFDQRLKDEQKKKMYLKLLPIEKLNQDLINIRSSFDIKKVLDDIISKCSCHYGIGINSSQDDLIYSMMCSNCYSNYQFICHAINYKTINTTIDIIHIYDNYFSINPRTDEWLECNKKIFLKLINHWNSLRKEDKDFEEYYLLISNFFRDQYYSDLLNRDKECELLKNPHFTCPQPIKCSGCSCVLICSTRIKNSLPMGSYGSRLFDLDHVHMIDQSKLPKWWIDNANICDWCFYQVVKSGAITDTIYGYYCEDCPTKIRQYNEIV